MIAPLLFALSTTSTHCSTTDVRLDQPGGTTLVERQLAGCGPQYPDNVLWHLDRADGVQDGAATRRTTGKGAVIYIVDVGMDASHDEFQRDGGTNVIGGLDPDVTRGIPGFNCPGGSPTHPCSGLPVIFSHGTAVASVAAGRNNGVAPDASIVAVRLLDGGPVTFLYALQDIVKHAYDPATPQFRTAIINMSQSISGSSEAAERNGDFLRLLKIMTTGVSKDLQPDPEGKKFLFVTVAGNRNFANANQCAADGGVTILPAVFGPEIDGLITVGGMDRQNAFWFGSCEGDKVEILAPADHVLTASNTGHNLYRGDVIDAKGNVSDYMSGTSYAAPYVCGIAARMLEDNPSLTPVELEARIKASPSYVSTAGAPAGGHVAVLVETPPPPPGPRRRAVGH